MGDLKRRIYELASADEELARQLTATGSTEELASVLKEHGVDATAEELDALTADASEELSTDELEAVAGGGKCICVVVGVGTKSNENEKVCVCVVGGGFKVELQNGPDACICPVLGGGH